MVKYIINSLTKCLRSRSKFTKNVSQKYMSQQFKHNLKIVSLSDDVRNSALMEKMKTTPVAFNNLLPRATSYFD